VDLATPRKAKNEVDKSISVARITALPRVILVGFDVAIMGLGLTILAGLLCYCVPHLNLFITVVSSTVRKLYPIPFGVNTAMLLFQKLSMLITHRRYPSSQCSASPASANPSILPSSTARVTSPSLLAPQKAPSHPDTPHIISRSSGSSHVSLQSPAFAGSLAFSTAANTINELQGRLQGGRLGGLVRRTTDRFLGTVGVSGTYQKQGGGERNVLVKLKSIGCNNTTSVSEVELIDQNLKREMTELWNRLLTGRRKSSEILIQDMSLKTSSPEY
jgi:hypothetical protein